MVNSLEAVTSRYIDSYHVLDRYGNYMSESYTICHINADGFLTNEIVTGEELEALCANNSSLRSKLTNQGIGTDILGNACFTTENLSRFIKYGLDDQGNLYAFNYTGEKQLVSQNGMPSAEILKFYEVSKKELPELNNIIGTYNGLFTENYDTQTWARNAIGLCTPEEDVEMSHLVYKLYNDAVDFYKDYYTKDENRNKTFAELRTDLGNELDNQYNAMKQNLLDEQGELTEQGKILQGAYYKISPRISNSSQDTLQSELNDLVDWAEDLLMVMERLEWFVNSAKIENSLLTGTNVYTIKAELDTLVNDLTNELSPFNNVNFFSPIAETYNITWGNITANGLSIMRLIMLMTIARAESVEDSLVKEMDKLAQNSELLRISASMIEYMLRTADATPDEYMSGYVYYDDDCGGVKPIGDWLKNKLEIDSSIVLPTTGGWSKETKEAVIKAIEDRQDALNVISQESSITIQSLINKRDQCYLLGSNATKLLYSGNLSVARNI